MTNNFDNHLSDNSLRQICLKDHNETRSFIEESCIPSFRQKYELTGFEKEAQYNDFLSLLVKSVKRAFP